MSRSLRFHPEAETELNDAADYYAPQSPGLDQRFIPELELALAQIVAFPEASSPVNARTRRKILPAYPYSIMYSWTNGRSASLPWPTMRAARSTGMVVSRPRTG